MSGSVKGSVRRAVWIGAAWAWALCKVPATAAEAEPGQHPDADPPEAPSVLPLKGMLPAGSPLFSWLDSARMQHPALQAANARSRAARMLAAGVMLEFKDPALVASAGYAHGPVEAPNLTMARMVPADAFSVQAGMEAPLWGGLYGGVGASLRQLDPEGTSGNPVQSVAGGRLRLPLLRDRGFQFARLDEGLRSAEAWRLEAEADRTEQEVTRDVAQAYAEWLRERADAHEVGRAMERAGKLLEETAARAALAVVPEYQVFPARFEAALRKEELEFSRQQIRVREQILQERIGLPTPTPPILPDDPADLFVRWAHALAGTAVFPVERQGALRRRAEYRHVQARLLASELAIRRTAESQKGDLSLQAGLHWDWREGAEPGDPQDSQAGFEVALRYGRRLGQRGERARLEAAYAEHESLVSDLLAVEIRILSQVAQAVTAWEGACRRLALAREAVIEAGRVLEAEDERFSLGEGFSRNVLDAQKDLTAASRRKVAVAGQVIAAMIELRHALGLAQDGGFP